MVILKSKRTGKFLRHHSGSFNNYRWTMRWKIQKTRKADLPPLPQGRWDDPEFKLARYEYETALSELVHKEMFNSEALEARRYATVGSAKQSLYSFKKPDWLEFHEIVAGNLCLVNSEDDEAEKQRKKEDCR